MTLRKGMSKGQSGGVVAADDLAEEELNPKAVVVDDPIVGEELTTLDENGPGAIQP